MVAMTTVCCVLVRILATLLLRANGAIDMLIILKCSELLHLFCSIE